jgi:hypothetical protein
LLSFALSFASRSSMANRVLTRPLRPGTVVKLSPSKKAVNRFPGFARVAT